MAAMIRIGISGWRYAPWRGLFCPDKLTQARELQYASRTFPAIEINGTFYALQTPASFEKWAQDTPGNFEFTVKAPKYITHTRRLAEPELPIANFMALGIFVLGNKLGPVLWQLPPGMRFDAVRCEAFLRLLPHTASECAAVASKREERMQDKELVEPVAGLRMRHAVEVRNASFVDPAFIALLRKYKVALVIADTGGRWPEFEDLTADFVYLRLHGASELYASGYSDKQLNHWAARIHQWSQGGQAPDARLVSDVPPAKAAQREVFCFFDNTMKIEAPNNARRLMQKLGLPERPV